MHQYEISKYQILNVRNNFVLYRSTMVKTYYRIFFLLFGISIMSPAYLARIIETYVLLREVGFDHRVINKIFSQSDLWYRPITKLFYRFYYYTSCSYHKNHLRQHVKRLVSIECRFWVKRNIYFCLTITFNVVIRMT